MSKKEKRKLFSLGRGCAPENSYMFRLPISEDEPFIGDFVTAVELVRGELQDAGISAEMMRKVELRISGLLIEIKGDEEVVARLEGIHKEFLKRFE